MNLMFIHDVYEQWSSTINDHSQSYEHLSSCAFLFSIVNLKLPMFNEDWDFEKRWRRPNGRKIGFSGMLLNANLSFIALEKLFWKAPGPVSLLPFSWKSKQFPGIMFTELCPWSLEQMNKSINTSHPFSDKWNILPFFRYDKLFVDNKLYVWSEVQGRVVEQVFFIAFFLFSKISALKW